MAAARVFLQVLAARSYAHGFVHSLARAPSPQSLRSLSKIFMQGLSRTDLENRTLVAVILVVSRLPRTIQVLFSAQSLEYGTGSHMRYSLDLREAGSSYKLASKSVTTSSGRLQD